jgi:deferrochelatase/peroxidase EfeB
MGARSVTNPAKTTSWKLRPPHDTRTQGLVVSGFNKLPSAEALFLFFDWPENGPEGPHTDGKGAWLRKLNDVAPITDADEADPCAAALAFTWTGLQKMGLSPDALGTFSAPFREGMYQEDRLRRLGDRIDGEWQGTVIEGGPRWSANIPVSREKRARSTERRLAEIGRPPEQEKVGVATPITVHALLLLYERDKARTKAWAEVVENQLTHDGVKIVHRLSLDLHLKDGIGREHFGFADGLSQPIPFAAQGRDGIADDCVTIKHSEAATRDPWHGVPLGEILLGHINAHHESAPGPMLPENAAGAADLPTDGAPDGFRNLGLDSSYLVVRELRQYVAAFWNSLEAAAARIRAHDRGGPPITADWLAERIVGRNLDGHLLCPSGPLAADANNLPRNDFGFMKTDRYGLGCPLGSHVRRGNPRDGLANEPASARTLLDASNNHRILRRGRKFGPPPPPPENRLKEDNQVRGLLFMCLNTDIPRQFEFIQQNWILNQNFATLFDETDPLVGPKGQFTIPEQPLRRTITVETFVQSAGGEYFFLPSIPAIKYLATL